jgi:hypothetical protein
MGFKGIFYNRMGKDPRCKVSRRALMERITKSGLSPEEAISLPPQKRSAFILERVRGI